MGRVACTKAQKCSNSLVERWRQHQGEGRHAQPSRWQAGRPIALAGLGDDPPSPTMWPACAAEWELGAWAL
eukprot:scaffold65567_cov27-Tisochrysis_lutea.AAC.2